MKKLIVFDLDGTLAKSKLGCTMCRRKRTAMRAVLLVVCAAPVGLVRHGGTARTLTTQRAGGRRPGST